MIKYLTERGDFEEEDDPLFIFKDNRGAKPDQFQRVLHKAIKNIGLDETLYNSHSLCVDRSCDLYKDGMEINTIKKFGRWKSNTVYEYLKQEY